MCPTVVKTRCWLRVGDLTLGWTMLMWCEEESPAYLFISQCLKGHWCLPLQPPYHSTRDHANTTDNNHQRPIRRALSTAASHLYKLKKTTSLSAWQFLCPHIFTLCEMVFICLQTLRIILCFKGVFSFTSESTQAQLSVDFIVWALAWYSLKEKAYNNSHMKCHNSPSCMRYWLLTHSDTRALFPAENIFEFTDWLRNPLPCTADDSIYSK